MQLARAEALADGGLEMAVLRLRAAPSNVGGAGGRIGELTVCRLEGAGIIAFGIEDEAGKVDLNTASEALLRALFTGLGAASDEAEGYVAQILRHRAQDGSARLGRDEGSARTPATGERGAIGEGNGFETAAELDRVPGLPADLRGRARRWLTVHSQSRGVDQSVMNPMLIEILQAGVGLGSEAASARGAFSSNLPAALTSPSSRRAFRVRAIGLVGGVSFVREAVMTPLASRRGAMQWRSWKQGSMSDEDELRLRDAGELPPC